MALENSMPYIARGPFTVWIMTTTQFPSSVYTPLTLDVDGSFLKPNATTYSSAKLAGYTDGDVAFKRTPAVNDFKFNEVAGTALQIYSDETVQVTFSSDTPLKPIILDTIQGGYHTQHVTATKTTDYFYGGNTTLDATYGVLLLAKQLNDNELAFCCPKVSLTGDFGAALARGGIAKSGLTFTALASGTRELWWGIRSYTNTELA